MATKRPRREVWIGGEWCKVKASELDWREGWLRYELRDGTNGLAQPKNWRGEGKEEHGN